MLTGQYNRTLDSKQRVTLPSDFRDAVGKKVCLINLEGALQGFTPDGFRVWMDSLFERDGKHFDPRNRNDVRLKRALTSQAQTIEIDAAGRVALGKLGAKTLESLGFDREVVIIGADDHFEIWDAAAWDAEEDMLDSDLHQLMYGVTA